MILEPIHSAIPYSSWDEWNPRDYLNTYFKKLGPDSYVTLEFLVQELRKFKPKSKMRILDFGSGPTIFGAMAAVPFASELHLADYLQSNLDELEKWINNKSSAFDWKRAIGYVLKLEGIRDSSTNIKKRAAEIKKVTTKLLRCDASLQLPLGIEENYPLVLSLFCADSATSSKDVWKIYIKNIFSLVAPGGTILMASLRNCSAYKNGDLFFPCANIDEKDIESALMGNKTDLTDLTIKVRDVPECSDDGFTSLILVSAKRKE